MEQQKTVSRIAALVGTLLIAAVIFLLLLVCFFMEPWRSTQNEWYGTGIVQIDLNGGQSVIEEEALTFQPGQVTTRSFYLENTGTCAVYYRLYFAEVEGALADSVQVTVSDERAVLYCGTVTQLSREAVSAADDVLAVGERRTLYISFALAQAADNGVQAQPLHFTLCADAVQAENNPERNFD